MAATSNKTSVKQRGGKVRATKKVVPAPTPEPTAKYYLPIRISEDLLDRIDAIRPEMTPREPFVRHVLDIGLKRLERRG
jgi:hypothetical protein